MDRYLICQTTSKGGWGHILTTFNTRMLLQSNPLSPLPRNADRTPYNSTTSPEFCWVLLACGEIHTHRRNAIMQWFMQITASEWRPCSPQQARLSCCYSCKQHADKRRMRRCNLLPEMLVQMSMTGSPCGHRRHSLIPGGDLCGQTPSDWNPVTKSTFNSRSKWARKVGWGSRKFNVGGALGLAEDFIPLVDFIYSKFIVNIRCDQMFDICTL